jgi:hypothetical protein
MPSVYIDSRVLGGVSANTGSAIVVVEYFAERVKQKRRCDVTWHRVFREDKPQPTSRWQYALFIFFLFFLISIFIPLQLCKYG